MDKVNDRYTPSYRSKGEFNPARTIQVWAYEDAPTEYQTNDDDSDWVAFVPDGVEQPSWMWEGSNFGCCTVTETKVAGGRIFTGFHA